MRILIGTVEIAGIAANLKRGFLEAGVDAETVLGASHPYQYDGANRPRLLTRLWQWIDGKAKSAGDGGQPGIAGLYRRAHRLFGTVVLLHALVRYDVCIFLFGVTLTNTAAELRLLRWLGKRIVFVYVGSDTRPPYVNGAQYPESGLPNSAHIAKLTAAVKNRLRAQELCADYCINSPFTAQLHERRYINWFGMGLPRQPPDSRPDAAADTGPVTRILHAPSRIDAKGTAAIRLAVDRLKDAGHEIDYVEVRNQPNAVVIEEIVKCDFVIDQVYSDTPMAAFATEAASHGKPAVVGGYAAESFPNHVEEYATPPSLFVPPDRIENAIERLILDREYRLQLGDAAHRFVKDRWAPRAVAERYIQLLNGDFPASWWCNPADIRYVSGAAVADVRSKALIAEMIRHHGLDSLQLADKPALEALFAEFAARPDAREDEPKATMDARTPD